MQEKVKKWMKENDLTPTPLPTVQISNVLPRATASAIPNHAQLHLAHWNVFELTIRMILYFDVPYIKFLLKEGFTPSILAIPTAYVSQIL